MMWMTGTTVRPDQSTEANTRNSKELAWRTALTRAKGHIESSHAAQIKAADLCFIHTHLVEARLIGPTRSQRNCEVLFRAGTCEAVGLRKWGWKLLLVSDFGYHRQLLQYIFKHLTALGFPVILDEAWLKDCLCSHVLILGIVWSISRYGLENIFHGP